MTDYYSILNVCNEQCPLPLLKLMQAIKEGGKQNMIHVIATDPTTVNDFYAFAQRSNLRIQHHQDDGYYYFNIKGYT